MDSEVVPPQKKKKTIHLRRFCHFQMYILHCLARISRSYYPKLSLVCKTFRDLVLSSELYQARFHHKTQEVFFHVCLQFPNSPLPSWFTLWIKPDQILTNEIKKKKKKKSTGNTLLVPVSSSKYPRLPLFTVNVGSEYYALKQHNDPSAVMLVRNKEISLWCQTPNMTVARVNAVAAVLDEKIYVMGGCGANESTNWAEVFDTKTQTWESLPVPGAELRISSIRKITVVQGKLKVSTNGKKDYVYDPKEGKWEVVEKSPVPCMIGNICVYCDELRLWWYDTKRKEWRVVRGLAMLNKNRRCGMIEIAEYHGKPLILWDKFVHHGRREYKNIWCAVIALFETASSWIRAFVF